MGSMETYSFEFSNWARTAIVADGWENLCRFSCEEGERWFGDGRRGGGF